MYDYVVVGSGLFGATCAYELTRAGRSCLVLEARSHIGGNCYTETRDGINLHIYGPHIFHTSSNRIWEWVNQFVSFNSYRFSPVANYQGILYSLPFNMWTFNQMWGVATPKDAMEIISSQSKGIASPRNLEEMAIQMVGVDIYERLIKGYTKKQWDRDPALLPKEIVARLAVRYTYDNSYFDDKHQGVVEGGYTLLFERLLENVKVYLGVDYLQDKPAWDKMARMGVIYTGAIDAYHSYCYGKLDYRSQNFVHKKLETGDYQGVSVMNYTGEEVPYTRVVEHKHFEANASPVSWVTWEHPEDEGLPMYPIRDKPNLQKLSRYNALADGVHFGGRLGSYQYYDMHQVIGSALALTDKLIA